MRVKDLINVLSSLPNDEMHILIGKTDKLVLKLSREQFKIVRAREKPTQKTDSKTIQHYEVTAPSVVSNADVDYLLIEID